MVGLSLGIVVVYSTGSLQACSSVCLLASVAVLVQEEFGGEGWLLCRRQRLLLCRLQNSHGDIAWCVSEVHLHTQSRAPLTLYSACKTPNSWVEEL